MDSEHSVWRRGPFYESWANGGEDVLKVARPGKRIRGCRRDLLKECGGLKGDAFVEQEFECEFVENGWLLVNQDHVDGIMGVKLLCKTNCGMWPALI